jgi:hypothetical protein
MEPKESLTTEETTTSNMKRGYKRFLIPAASLLILLMAGGIIMGVASSNAKPLSIVERFEDAIIEGNVKQVMKLTEPGDPLLIMNEKNAQQLITYYKDNPSTFTDEMEQLRFDAEMWNDEQAGRDKNEVLTFVTREDQQGFFGKYAIEVTPAYFQVMTNQKGTVFYLNDEEILTAKVDHYNKILGPFLPGDYEVRVDYDGEYVSLSTEREVKLPRDHDEDIDLSLKAHYIYPESDDWEAQLFVNDKDTGQTFREMERFGPVATDGSMTVQAQKKTEWGTLYSEKVQVSDEDLYPYLSLEGLYIYPTTNFPEDARLLINDEYTDASLDYTSYEGFGPLPYDTVLTMQVEKEFPWGTYRSEKKPIKEGATWEEDYLEINPLDDAVREQIMGDVNNFLDTMLEAYTLGDTSGLQNAADQVKEDIAGYVEYDSYEGELIKVVYDLETFSIYQDEAGQYNSYLSGIFTVNELDFYTNTVEPYEITWNFTVVYDEDSESWNVSQYNESYYFDGVETREFIF